MQPPINCQGIFSNYDPQGSEVDKTSVSTEQNFINELNQNENENNFSQTKNELFEALCHKFSQTITKTSKADKYVRLACQIVKLIRLQNNECKKRFGKLYKQMLILRQVFRWNGIWETIQEFSQEGSAALQSGELFMTLFKVFMVFGDILDRMIFALEILKIEKYKNFLIKIETIESDCYFIQCVLWLAFNITTLRGLQGKKRNIKIAKIMKYILDCFTTHNKFSGRIFQLDPKIAAMMGIISSLLGLYTILA